MLVYEASIGGMGAGTNGPVRVGSDPFVVLGVFLGHYVAFPISPSFFPYFRTPVVHLLERGTWG